MSHVDRIMARVNCDVDRYRREARGTEHTLEKSATVDRFRDLTAGKFEHLAQKNGTDLKVVFLGSAHQ